MFVSINPRFRNSCIVDDYSGILRRLSLFLREEGYEVDEAYNGVEAVEKLCRPAI